MKHSFIFLWFLTLPFFLSAQNFSSPFKYNPLDRDAGGHFGTSVAIFGNYAIVGSYNASDTAFSSQRYGAVHFFERSNGLEWIEVDVKYPPANTHNPGMEFGYSVDIFDDVAVVGARKYSYGPYYEGAVFVYKRLANGTWKFFQEITATDAKAGSEFGYSLAVTNNRIAIGAIYADKDSLSTALYSDCGRAYVYKSTGGLYVEEAKIMSPELQDNALFGSSIDIDNNVLIVGANGQDETTTSLVNTGAAFIYQLQLNTWNFDAKIWPIKRASSDGFGYSVSIQNNIALVGAIGEDDDANNGNKVQDAGAAYVFEKSGSIWSQTFKFVSTSRNISDQFGSAVALDGDYALIGSKNDYHDENDKNGLQFAGSAFVFERKSSLNWDLLNKFAAPFREAKDEFGVSVAIANKNIIIGSWNEDHDRNEENFVSNAGSAYFIRECDAPLINTVSKTIDSLYSDQDNALYQWWDCNLNQLILGETKRVFYPPAVGNYAVILNYFGCIDTTLCVGFTSGINDIDTQNNLKIWPNPAKDKLYINSYDNQNVPVKIELYNMNSQLIYSKSMIPANTNEVDVSQLDPGMYLVIVTSGQYRESQKIIIE